MSFSIAKLNCAYAPHPAKLKSADIFMWLAYSEVDVTISLLMISYATDSESLKTPPSILNAIPLTENPVELTPYKCYSPC